MYKTINQTSITSIKIQRSEFIATLYPVVEVHKVKEIFALHNEQYKDATHNCYAYIIGKKQEWQYYSDQGEPSGTAGKPILNALLKHNLTNVLAIVTRYFGGIKLGVRGLIDAYSDATEQALETTELIDFRVMESMIIKLDYSVLDSLKHFLKDFHAGLEVIEFSSDIKAELVFPEESNVAVMQYVNDLTQKGFVKKVQFE